MAVFQDGHWSSRRTHDRHIGKRDAHRIDFVVELELGILGHRRLVARRQRLAEGRREPQLHASRAVGPPGQLDILTVDACKGERLLFSTCSASSSYARSVKSELALPS